MPRSDAGWRVPFDRHLITLELTRTARFHFHHGGVLSGLLRGALGTHALDDGLVPFACESGRTRFDRGDRYRFGLTLAGDTRAVLEPLVRGLERLGAAPPDPDRPQPALAGNFSVSGVERMPETNVGDEASRLASAAAGGGRRVTLRFISPLRLERPRELETSGERHVNERCFPAPHVLDRLHARVLRLARGRPLHIGEEARQAPDGAGSVAAVPDHLLWLDIPVKGLKPERWKKGGIKLGGVLGRVVLEGVPDDWLPWIVAGRHLHLGQNAHFGLGRYVIEELGGIESEPFRPAATVWDRLQDRAALERALVHIRGSRDEESAPDGLDEGDASPEGLVSELLGQLAAGTYEPGPLYGFVVPRKERQLRALAVPGLRDRVLQRAACELLAPAVDTLLEDCSHGYRRGHSRGGAAREVSEAWREGYRWVLDADITAFFDTVDWSRLFAKARALYPFDPIVGRLEAWVTAPVLFRGHRLTRTRGLPQGIAVSPLLANLYLDELDEALLDRNFRLVRYADDFVILARDLEAAKAARDAARDALGPLGLTLNDAKTGIVSLERGFSYLGYLFCRSLVMEQQYAAGADEDLARATAPPDVPPASWLAQVPLADVRQLDPPAAGASVSRSGPTASPLRPAGPGGGDRVTVYVASHAARLRLQNAQLVVERAGEEAVVLPLRGIAHVTVCGRVDLTVPLLLALADAGAPVYFCRRNGQLTGVFGPHRADWTVWTAQARAAADSDACLRFSRAIVSAKLRNQAAVLVRFGLEAAPAVAAELRSLAADAERAASLESLRGFEGRGAARYFASLAANLAPEWGFDGRERRPPPDPVNAMLSFGYTLLYHHASTALTAQGLNPRIGLFHRDHGAHHALASDLVEELRHLVDRFVWTLVSKRTAQPQHFRREGDACLMTHELRGVFIEGFERRLTTTFTPPGGAPQTYRVFMDRQARALRACVADGTEYVPLREHA